METYVNSAGKTLSAAQAEQEYRQQLIVAGRPLEGADYDRGLQEWLSTYRKLSKNDKRSITAATTVVAIGVALSALIAIFTLVAGAGLIAFVVILIVGGLISFGLAGLVVIFTSTKGD